MKVQFKNLLNEQFKTAKEYKPKLEWYVGVLSMFKPELGKDKRGITGVTIDKIKKICNDGNLQTNNTLKDLIKVFDWNHMINQYDTLFENIIK